MDRPLAIRARGLHKRYGDKTVLDGLDLDVEAGTVFALLGPNGAGKTTTVRLLATLIEADSGTAEVAGADVRSRRATVRERIALTGQYAAVDELQSGTENLRMMGRLAGLRQKEAAARAEVLLDAFDLRDAAGRLVKTYSGGMRRRLDIAASIVVPPQVVFLDEPTTGLDPRSRQAMWGLVRILVTSGVTVFLTTQYLEEADQLADRIAVIDGGRLVAEGTAAELKQRVGGQRLDATFADDRAFADAVLRFGARVVHQDRAERTLGLAVEHDATSVRELLDEIDPDHQVLTRFALHSATLDDVFLALTGSPVTPALHGKVSADA